MSYRSNCRHNSVDVLSTAFVVLAATAANAGAPAGLPPTHAAELFSRPYVLDLSAPRMGRVTEQERRLRLDQMRGSSATAAVSTRQFANPGVDGEFRPKSTFIIHWQKKPDIVRIARNLRRNGLPIVRLWHSGRSLFAFGLSPRGVPGLYLTQKAPD
jgi:hypothetical protein